MAHLVAFSSPKGGVGRTMVLANIAALLTRGVKHVGIPPMKVLALDFDFDAPGLHYYDFLSELKTDCNTKLNCYFRDQEYSRHEDFIEALQKTGAGLIFWLQAILSNEDITILRNKGKIEGNYHKSVHKIADYFRRIKQDFNDPCNPFSHLLTMAFGQEGAGTLLVFPAGDSKNLNYSDAVLDFDWNAFVNKEDGLIFLDALFSLFLPDASHKNVEHPIPEIEWILLDQGAGRSIPSVINQSIARSNILVSGLNLQNEAGLYNALEELQKHNSLTEARVVFSQNKSRISGSLAQTSVPDNPLLKQSPHLGSHSTFINADDKRFKITKALKERFSGSIQIYTIDFHVEAIQREFFFPNGTPSYDELVRLAVSLHPQSDDNISKGFNPNCANDREIRILGEFVGTGATEDAPSGPLLGLCKALKKRNPQLNPIGYAVDHEDIADLLLEKKVRLNEPQETDPCEMVTRYKKVAGPGGKQYCPSDFDIIATPIYLIRDAIDNGILNKYQHGLLNGVKSPDSLIDINDSYLSHYIIGWSDYSKLETGDIIGFPLFVAYPLLAWNSDKLLNNAFLKDYYSKECREFRGFFDPADILCVSRSAAFNSVPDDRFQMSIKADHISQWYEWLTCLAIFDSKVNNHLAEMFTGANFDIKFSDNSTLVKATRLFLELASYAETKSSESEWVKTTRLFFKEKKVGAAFFWPDAIPSEYRSDEEFRFQPPPGGAQWQECWLLTVPTGNTRWTPAELQHLLLDFMTLPAQEIYQTTGGLSVHRRVLLNLDLWRLFPFLPQLEGLFIEGFSRQRTFRSKQYTFAKEFTRSLDKLKYWINKQIKDKRAEIIWQDTGFQEEVDNKIREELSIILCYSLA